jgi:hypothetical protein
MMLSLHDAVGDWLLVATASADPASHRGTRVRFDDPVSAFGHLQRFRGNHAAMTSLREALAGDGVSSSRLDDDEILQRVASQLATGWLSLYRLEAPLLLGVAVTRAPVREPPPPEPARREPEIVRCRWSASRAWQTQEVSMIVETANVPEGARLDISVWESDRDEGSPDDRIDRVTERTRGDRTEVFFAFNLTPEEMRREARLEGRVQEFYFQAALPDLALKARSELIYVPIPTYVYG